jgi:hypothetical protein
MEEQNPWNSILKPRSGNSFGSKRVDGITKHNFWWALDCHGRVGFAVEFKSEITLPSALPKFSTIDVVLSPDSKFLLLFLKHSDVQRKFRLLCHDLILEAQSVDAGASKVLLENVTSTLKRWQRLFETTTQPSPTLPQKLGLIGELNCLVNFLAVRIGFRNAIDAWQGPKGHEQDFSINGQLIEVKAQLSSSDKIVKINSLEQLDTISGPIWLTHVGLSPASSDLAGAVSINSLIQTTINGLGGDNFGIDIFVTLLEQLGFNVENKYGDEYYVLPFENFFQIREDFPALTRSKVPSTAISKANYLLDMSELSSWDVSPDFVAEAVFSD